MVPSSLDESCSLERPFHAEDEDEDDDDEEDDDEEDEEEDFFPTIPCELAFFEK